MRKTIFILTMVLTLLLSSCGVNDTLPIPAGMTEESGEYATYAQCVESCDLCESNCLDNVYYSMAVVESNLDVCERIQSVSLKEVCEQELIALEALANNNAAGCEKLTDEGSKNVCLQRVYAAEAFATGDVGICSVLEDPSGCQQRFYQDMAFSSGDITYCDMVEEVDDCIERVESQNVGYVSSDE
jgi:hypothetical protein